MFSFGPIGCNGNRGEFTVCAVNNNLGILVVVFIPKRPDLNCRFYVVEATLENKCTVSVCVFKTTIMRVMLSVLSVYTISCCLPCRVGYYFYL